jgi:hypothetical protein
MNENVIYFIRRKSDGAIKIGTTICLGDRLATIRREIGESVEMLGIVSGGRVREKILHWCFSSTRLSPSEEWFEASTELFDMIKQYTEMPTEEMLKTTPKPYRKKQTKQPEQKNQVVLPRLEIVFNFAYLHNLILSRGFNVSQFAAVSGICQPQLSYFVTGKQRPNSKNLGRILTALDMTLDEARAAFCELYTIIEVDND